MTGIAADFTGSEKSLGGVLTREVWIGIVKEYPRSGLKDGMIQVMCSLCKTKPETMYDNLAGEFGDKFVEGYNKEGSGALDATLATVED